MMLRWCSDPGSCHNPNGGAVRAHTRRTNPAGNDWAIHGHRTHTCMNSALHRDRHALRPPCTATAMPRDCHDHDCHAAIHRDRHHCDRHAPRLP
eukprot:228808-Chlamydomonas_euryale.AAC.2